MKYEIYKSDLFTKESDLQKRYLYFLTHLSILTKLPLLSNLSFLPSASFTL